MNELTIANHFILLFKHNIFFKRSPNLISNKGYICFIYFDNVLFPLFLLSYFVICAIVIKPSTCEVQCLLLKKVEIFLES